MLGHSRFTTPIATVNRESAPVIVHILRVIAGIGLAVCAILALVAIGDIDQGDPAARLTLVAALSGAVSAILLLAFAQLLAYVHSILHHLRGA